MSAVYNVGVQSMWVEQCCCVCVCVCVLSVGEYFEEGRLMMQMRMTVMRVRVRRTIRGEYKEQCCCVCVCGGERVVLFEEGWRLMMQMRGTVMRV